MKNKGISLIVLIITIVVIIILAAAVILTISKNNPVESAKKATFLSDVSSYQDELSMYVGQEYISKEGNYDVTVLDGTALEDIIDIHSKYNEKFTIKDGKIFGTDKLTDQEKEWIKSITGGETGTIEAPSNYTDANGKKAYIPAGFTVSEVEAEKKIDTGLVIKDEKKNEFVWIPVDFTDNADFVAKFVRKDGYTNGVLQNVLSNCNEPNISATQGEIDEHKAMVDSVKKYHGYYIARYETSNDGSGNVQTKPNTVPWNSISWATNMTNLTGGAVEKSRAMYPASTATQGSAVSTLIYGVQWDLAFDFIEKYGVKNTTYRTDSTGKGNYLPTSGSLLINTGSNANYALNNIYDMAGNVWEWTMESCNGSNRVYRSGSYLGTGLNYPASCRIDGSADLNLYLIGFRIGLYIK